MNAKEYKPTHGGYPGTVPVRVPSFPVRENLLAALALIEKRENWTRGQLGIGTGCYCMLGAIATQQGMKETGHVRGIYSALEALPEVQHLAEGLREEEPTRFKIWTRDTTIIYKANDDTALSQRDDVRHEQTIALFRRAIQRVQA